MDYTIKDARHAHGMKIIQCYSPDGFKTRAHRLASTKNINGKYVHRAGGYCVTPSGAREFERLYAEGWDASYVTGLKEPRRPNDPTPNRTPRRSASGTERAEPSDA